MQAIGEQQVSPRGQAQQGLDGLEVIFLAGAAVWIVAMLAYF